MAKAPATSSSNDATSAQPSILVALLLLTIIAGCCGAGFAFVFLKKKPDLPAVAEVKEPSKQDDKSKIQSNRFPKDAVEVPLDPIVTSIGPDAKTKMRIEASMIVKKDGATSPTLKKEMAEDIVTFLSGVTAAEISGVRGFLNLREDLDDRARIRGRGMVLGLLISGFVVE